MKTRAIQVIELCEQYREQVRELKKQTRFPSEQVERQTMGRIGTLERIADELAAISEDMKPAPVQAVVEGVLALLAEHKATWLVNSIRERRQFGINELGEWMAMGAIAQIDEIFPQLCSRLSPNWNASSGKKHGHYFHVYQRLERAPVVDTELEKERWRGEARQRWYGEVAIIGEQQTGDQLEQVYRLTNRHHWWELKRGVLWIQRDAPFRLTSTGDVLVSVLSGSAWLVCDDGFQVIDPAGGGQGD